jgi:uncharacterized lipoprotein NlpE involved in copper resistance
MDNTRRNEQKIYFLGGENNNKYNGRPETTTTTNIYIFSIKI